VEIFWVMATTAGPSVPSAKDLWAELRAVAGVGADPATNLVGIVPLLSGLQIVRSVATSDQSEHLARAVVTVLNQVLEQLAGSPTGEAARILLGLDHDTRHYKLGRRRERAASELFPDGRGEKTFRTKDEPSLLRIVAEQLLVMEARLRRGTADPGVARPTVPDDATRRWAGPQGGEPGRQRRRLAAAASVAALVIAADVLSQRSRGPAGGTSAASTTSASVTAPFALRDQFTDPRSLWPAHDSADKVVTTTGGQYQVLLKKFPSDAFMEAPWADIPKNVRAEVKATKMSPEPGSFGVFCRSGAGERYRGLIDLTGTWRVEKIVRPASAPAQRLAVGTSTAIIAGDNVVALGCRGGEPGKSPVLLTLSVNGTVVASDVPDPGDALVAGRAGVEVVSNRGEVRVWFDDFSVAGL
jgi:hypothetical protein